MNWANLYEATAQNEKPTPGWVFKEICQDAEVCPDEVPDVAEYLMRCVLHDNRTVKMKACLCIRHLADEVLTYRQFMQRCPDALAILKKTAEPPQLAQAQTLERPEVKVLREAASRALRSCLAPLDVRKEVASLSVKSKIQGFGNFQPPPDPDELPPASGAKGMLDKVVGFVGDAVADTVDDFREKGAVGAVRDGIADAADLLVDGVGAVWDFLGGRKAKEKRQQSQVDDRICKPVDAFPSGGMPGGFAPGGFVPGPGGFGAPGGFSAPGGMAFPGAFQPQVPAAPAPAPAAYQGAFGRGAVGAGYSFSPAEMAAAGLAPSTPMPFPTTTVPERRVEEPKAPLSATELEDLMSFDDPPSPRQQMPDLLSFDEPSAAQSADGGAGPSASSSSMLGGRAAALKSRGNELVREKQYGEAVKAYEAALAAVGDMEGQQELRATVYANLAQCYLQQQLYRRAVDAASQSIANEPSNAKAYYRRCLAHKALKMLDEANRDLDALQFCKHEMKESDIARLRASLQA